MVWYGTIHLSYCYYVNSTVVITKRFSTPGSVFVKEPSVSLCVCVVWESHVTQELPILLLLVLPCCCCCCCYCCCYCCCFPFQIELLCNAFYIPNLLVLRMFACDIHIKLNQRVQLQLVRVFRFQAITITSTIVSRSIIFFKNTSITQPPVQCVTVGETAIFT